MVQEEQVEAPAAGLTRTLAPQTMDRVQLEVLGMATKAQAAAIMTPRTVGIPILEGIPTRIPVRMNTVLGPQEGQVSGTRHLTVTTRRAAVSIFFG